MRTPAARARRQAGLARGTLAHSASECLLTLEAGRIKACPGERCGWIFLDESPNNRRRWCSMATCGNRDKARRHYARRKAG
ncbi:CGNR zinc finger domain-containing protein [Tistlia sp.]|uniref:CGNR zinc finger domain-containing protein n=1 Tax=Tistlia sp. TaxID=3057121 RepID=UPI0034A10872